MSVNIAGADRSLDLSSAEEVSLPLQLMKAIVLAEKLQ
jgi:hypothetical protein